MPLQSLTINEIINTLGSDIKGLSVDQAKRRLAEFGPNVIEKSKRQSYVLKFLRGFTHFFAMILWCAAGIAFFAAWTQPESGMHTLGIAIIGVIIINGVFSFWQEYKAEEAILALENLMPRQAKAYREGNLVEISTTDLVPGDVIVIEEGDEVPGDCRIIEDFGIRVNNATITGESIPQARNSHISNEIDLKLSKNILLAGTSIFAGEGKAIVFQTGMHTEFGKIAKLAQISKPSLSPLQKEIARLSRVIVVIALGIGLCFFLIGVGIGISLWNSVLFAIGIIVALVPEGLLPEVTLALATCSRRMAKQNAIMRHLPSVETLGCTNVICTDKTGTLTQNRMIVKQLFLDGQPIEAINLIHNKVDRTLKGLSYLCDIAAHCHNIKTVKKEDQEFDAGDPMELALIEFAQKINSELLIHSKHIDEIPFDSDRKRLSTLHKDSSGLILYTKGALETLLPLCAQVYSKSQLISLDESSRQLFLKAQDIMTKNGLRVLALANKIVAPDYDKNSLENGLNLIGLVGFEDPPRPEVPEAISKCQQAGIKVIMITGDHPNTALAIATEIGLVKSSNPIIITGPQFREMSDAQLQIILHSPEIIFARADADQKMRIVMALRNSKHIVAATGDGVNDAPALKAADIGIAMGLTGTEVARQAADMILADDNFASIVRAIEEGRGVFANIRKFLTYVLASNIAELIPCLAFVVLHIPLPLSVIQILSIDLGTDLAPALALGAEKPDVGIMQKKPRSQKEGLFDIGLLSRAYLFLGLLISLASMSAYFYVLNQGNWHYGEILASNNPLYLEATTACLMGIMCMQIVNSSMCRSERQSLFL